MEEIIPLNNDAVKVSTLLYEHNNGVSVELKRHGDAWEVGGTRHHASWTDRNLSGDEAGYGEVIDEEIIKHRKSEAVNEAQKLDGVKSPVVA